MKGGERGRKIKGQVSFFFNLMFKGRTKCNGNSGLKLKKGLKCERVPQEILVKL